VANWQRCCSTATPKSASRAGQLEDVAVELSDEEAAILDGLRLPVYGADEGAALRDILFTWWEQKFLGAAESGAPAIGDRKA
jgi:uncharacterized protein